MVKEIKDGALKVIDFDCLHGTLNIVILAQAYQLLLVLYFK